METTRDGAPPPAALVVAEPPPPARDGTAPTVRRVAMTARKRIALIAHDHRKADLLDWARFNRGTLADHELFATGTTGGLMGELLRLDVARYLSGPLGGDQQVGAGIAEGRLDLVIFFWDPLQPQPHDVDVKALLRIAVVHNCPIACNRAHGRLPPVEPPDGRALRADGGGVRAVRILSCGGTEPERPREHGGDEGHGVATWRRRPGGGRRGGVAGDVGRHGCSSVG